MFLFQLTLQFKNSIIRKAVGKGSISQTDPRFAFYGSARIRSIASLYYIKEYQMYNLIAQAIGAVGMVIAFVVFQGNTRRHILLVQIASCAVFVIHFAMLGNMTAAFLNLLNIPRNIIFHLSDKYRWKSAELWVIVFMILFTLVGLFTWSAWYSFFPIIAMLASSAAFFSSNPTFIRVCQMICSPSWLVNNILCGSWSGMLTEIFNIVSLSIAFVRYDILKRPEAKGVKQDSEASQ